MKSLTGLRTIAFSAVLLLTACGGGLSTPGGEQSFVAGNGTVTFITQSHRAKAPATAGVDLNGKQFTKTVGGVLVFLVCAVPR
jgi:ABC-type glycerol-3-phosphate transport system substrate-binding protein